LTLTATAVRQSGEGEMTGQPDDLPTIDHLGFLESLDQTPGFLLEEPGHA
jgi:hypothetical protein